jgi:cytoskeletal protein RodZ
VKISKLRHNYLLCLRKIIFWEETKMSQEKVDAYKKEKKGRKERIAKEKKMRKIMKVVSLLVLVAAIGLISWGVYASKHPAAAADTQPADEAISMDDIINQNAEAADEAAGQETTEEAPAEEAVEGEAAEETTEEAPAEETTEATEGEAAEEPAEETAEDAAN